MQTNCSLKRDLKNHKLNAAKSCQLNQWLIVNCKRVKTKKTTLEFINKIGSFKSIQRRKCKQHYILKDLLGYYEHCLVGLIRIQVLRIEIKITKIDPELAKSKFKK